MRKSRMDKLLGCTSNAKQGRRIFKRAYEPHPPIVIYDVDGPLLPNKGPRLAVLKLLHNPWFKWDEEEKGKLTSLDILRIFESCESESNIAFVKKVIPKFKKLLPSVFRRIAFMIAFGVMLRKYEYRYDDFQPGAVDVIRSLHEKEFIQGICSNSETRRIKRWLERKELDDIIRCFTSRNHKALFGLKPSPRPLLGVLLLIKNHYALGKIDKKKVLFVGDNVTDIISAKKAGVYSAAVLNGHGLYGELSSSNPDFLIEGIHELPKIIDLWLNRTNRTP